MIDLPRPVRNLSQNLSPLNSTPDLGGVMKLDLLNNEEKYFIKHIVEREPLQTWYAGRELVLSIIPRSERQSRPVGEIMSLI